MRQFLKYELKREWKGILFACSLILFSFILLSIFILCVKNASSPSNIVMIIYSNIILLIGGTLIASVVLFIISLVKSLYNNIFTDEGYLTLTIPKSLDTLLISKFIAYFCWLFVYSIACFLGVLLISFSLETTVNDLFDDISIVFELLSGREKEIFFKLIEIFISSVLSLVMLVLTFACVNTGVFKKAKVICGILIFLFLEYAISIITLIFDRLSFGIGLDANQHLKFVYGSVYSPSFIEAGVSSYAMNFTAVIINLGLIFGFYFLIKYIIKNHLELE